MYRRRRCWRRRSGAPFSLSLSLSLSFLSFSLPCIYVRLCVAAKEEACQHTAPLLVHPLRVKPTRERERETGRLMAAIRARIKMVGPRQLYRLGSDGAVGMRVYTHNERGKKRSSRHSLIGIAPPVLALPVYLYTYTTPKWPTTNFVVRRHRLDL